MATRAEHREILKSVLRAVARCLCQRKTMVHLAYVGAEIESLGRDDAARLAFELTVCPSVSFALRVRELRVTFADEMNIMSGSPSIEAIASGSLGYMRDRESLERYA